MDGRVHVSAGCLAGAATTAIAFHAGWADTWSEAAVSGALCAAFALFPDLDTASRPQRWAARVLVVVLAGLAWAGRWREAALVGLAALLPLLTHHRGWTHRWWAVPLVPLGVIVLWHALLGGGSFGGGGAFTRGAIAPVREHLPAYAAMCAGYALHLLLDRVRLPARRR
jgi:hypothetical protein